MVVVQFIIFLLTTLLEMSMVKKKLARSRDCALQDYFKKHFFLYFPSLCTQTITLNLKNLFTFFGLLDIKLSRKKNSKLVDSN